MRSIRTALVLSGALGFSMSWAQWECPSRLGASLAPIGSSNFQFGAEFTHSLGLMNVYSTGEKGEELSNMVKISNDMLFMGLNYSMGKSSFYAEGGFKYWSRVDSIFEDGHDNFSYSEYDSILQDSVLVEFKDDSTAGETAGLVPGLRELFYSYRGENNALTLGLQTAKSDDYYLVNERIVGLNYRFTYGRWEANLLGGSVLSAFARNGTFCSVGYMQSIIPRRERSIIGRGFGQTNLVSLTAMVHPSMEVSAAPTSEGNEFSNEFSSEFGDGNAESSAKMLNWKTLGLAIYDEFGSWVETSALVVGLFTELEFAESFSVKPEVLYQTSKNNTGVIYSVEGDLHTSWDNGWQTKALVRYLGMSAMDSLAKPGTSFSNIFAGEILRLDSRDMPFLQVGLKHSFSEIKTSVKLQMAKQLSQRELSDQEKALGLEGKKFTEYDITIAKNFGEHYLVNLSGGFVDYYHLAIYEAKDADGNVTGYPDYYTGSTCLFGKLELRATF